LVEEHSKYAVLLLVRKYGVNMIWNISIVPEFAKVIVRNNILNKNESDYMISFSDENISHTKIGDATFVLFDKEEVKTSYNLTYKGVRLNELEREPRLLTLRKGEESIIKIKAGHVAILARYKDGELISNGSVDIFKLSNKEEFVSSWGWLDSILNLTLPYGRYKVRVMVGDAEQNKTFIVNKPNNFVNIEFLRSEVITKKDEGNELLFGLALFALIVEVLIAFKVWRRALKKV
jgi:hypothetical protein